MTLREWRKKQNLTQAETAERLGLSQGHLSKIERGEPLSLQKALEISAMTGGQVPLDSFLNKDPA